MTSIPSTSIYLGMCCGTAAVLYRVRHAFLAHRNPLFVGQKTIGSTHVLINWIKRLMKNSNRVLHTVLRAHITSVKYLKAVHSLHMFACMFAYVYLVFICHYIKWWLEQKILSCMPRTARTGSTLANTIHIDSWSFFLETRWIILRTIPLDLTIKIHRSSNSHLAPAVF